MVGHTTGRAWLPGCRAGLIGCRPSPRRARGHPKPGFPDTVGTLVSVEPSASGARVSVRVAKMAARVHAGRISVITPFSRHPLPIYPLPPPLASSIMIFALAGELSSFSQICLLSHVPGESIEALTSPLFRALLICSGDCSCMVIVCEGK